MTDKVTDTQDLAIEIDQPIEVNQMQSKCEPFDAVIATSTKRKTRGRPRKNEQSVQCKHCS